jgi:hypothetical protein
MGSNRRPQARSLSAGRHPGEMIDSRLGGFSWGPTSPPVPIPGPHPIPQPRSYPRAPIPPRPDPHPRVGTRGKTNDSRFGGFSWGPTVVARPDPWAPSDSPALILSPGPDRHPGPIPLPGLASGENDRFTIRWIFMASNRPRARSPPRTDPHPRVGTRGYGNAALRARRVAVYPNVETLRLRPRRKSREAVP